MQAFEIGGLADFSWVSINPRKRGITGNLVGIMAACIPTLKPLYVQHLGSNYFPWGKKSSSKGYIAYSNDTAMRKGIVRPLVDPYSTTTLETSATTPEAQRVYADPAHRRCFSDGGGSKVWFQNDIEVDDLMGGGIWLIS